MSAMTCPMCNVAMSSGRMQHDRRVVCFECSMHPHDMRTRIRKIDGPWPPPALSYIKFYKPDET